MTALLTDNLPLLAGSPNGIQKLRALILELAVRGKLVPQDPGDEPASALLKRINVEKQRLLVESKARKQKELAADVLSEHPYGVPKGWEWQTLDSVLYVTGGVTLGRKLAGRKLLTKPYLRVANVQRGHLVLDQIKEVEIPEDEVEKYLLLNGDLLITEGGDWDKVGRTAIWRDELPECLHQNHVFRARAVTTEWEPRWAEIYLNSATAREYFAGSSKQTTNLASINMTQLRACAFPLPPLAEQHRIVAKVDELMALCDRLEARQVDAGSAHAQLVQALLDSLTQATDAADFAISWQRLAEHFHTLFTTESSIDALKQTLLQLAVMGKLVPQIPEEDEASNWLERIQLEKQRLNQSRQLQKMKKAPGIELEMPVSELPKSWCWVTLTDITLGMDSGWSPACEPNPSPSDSVWGVLKTTAVQVMQYLQQENKELPSHLEPRPDAEVKVGDILFTRAGPTNRVGISCLVESTRSRLMISDKIIRFHPVEVGAYGRYITLCLNTGGTAMYLESAKSGMAASQVNISQEKLKKAPIPLPPLPEQHRIVAKVDQLMELCDQLKARLNQARQVHEHLANALVESALCADRQQTPAITDRKAARTLLAAEITHQLHGLKTFGQRKLQKVIHLAEHAAKLAAIQGSYLRDAAGPHDRQLMDQVEGELHNRQWYERIERDTVGHAYRPLPAAGQHRPEYESTWSATERATIQQVIDLMRGWDTDRCERVVTLYAAWNDFLLEGESVTDEMLVHEVMYSWNDTKLRFTEDEWRAELAEMKKQKLLIPTGFGKRTQGGMPTLTGLH